MNLSRNISGYEFRDNDNDDYNINSILTTTNGTKAINIASKKNFTENISLSVKIENLSDKDYFTAATGNGYYLNQGRSLWLKVAYDLR